MTLFSGLCILVMEKLVLQWFYYTAEDIGGKPYSPGFNNLRTGRKRCWILRKWYEKGLKNTCSYHTISYTEQTFYGIL